MKILSHKDYITENQLSIHSTGDVEEAKVRLEEMHNELNGIDKDSSEDLTEEASSQMKENVEDPHRYELDEDECSHHHHHEHSLIDDAKADLGVNLILEGEIDFPVAEVWRYLTTNELLKKWQPSLQINRLESGGSISIVRDGREREVMLMDVEANQSLSFVWGDDSIQYEFQEAEGKTLFELSYWFADSQSAQGKEVTPWLILLSDLEAHLSKIEPYNRNEDWVLKLTEEINMIIAEKKSRTIEF